MYISSNILIKYIIQFCTIFSLCFVLHTKQILANDNNSKEIVLQIIQLIETNQFSKVDVLIEKNNDKNLKDLANWLKISNNKIDKNILKSTLEEYKNWPDINKIIIKFEEEIGWDNNNDKIFEIKKPITNLGKIKYARHLIEKSKINKDKIIIKNWITGVFKKEDELFIYKNYSNLFDEDINLQRLNNLIWKKKWNSAYRQIKRVNKDNQILAKAKIKLSRREYGVDYAIKIIPKELINESGLVYERIKWRRVSGFKMESYKLLLSFLKNDNKPLKYPNVWWKEINWHTRDLINKKEYKKAYDLMIHHKQTKVSNIAYAEWLLGWISLEYLSQPQKAIKHFMNMEKIVKMPISIARANYWMGKAKENTNALEESNLYYERASNYNTTFYGLLASAKINKKVKLNLVNHDSAKGKADSEFQKKLNVLNLLSLADEKKYSLRFINGLFESKITRNEVLLVLNKLKDQKRTDLFIRACKNSIRIDKTFQNYLFPFPNSINPNILNNPLIAAIAKQESEFYPYAKSRSGALGLVQVMPSTAKITAKKLGIMYDKNKLSNDVEYNVYIGSKYLESLLKYYNGSKILAIASYNAGPTNVNKWIKIYGDPRDTSIDRINWIELIPFTETRNYVQRVLENYIVYQQVFINIAMENKVDIGEVF